MSAEVEAMILNILLFAMGFIFGLLLGIIVTFKHFDK